MVTTRHKEIIMQILPHSIIIFHLCCCCCWSFISCSDGLIHTQAATKCILSPSGNWTILFCFFCDSEGETKSKKKCREKLKLFKLPQQQHWTTFIGNRHRKKTASTRRFRKENYQPLKEAWTNADLIINYTFNYWQSAHGIWWYVIWNIYYL